MKQGHSFEYAESSCQDQSYSPPFVQISHFHSLNDRGNGSLSHSWLVLRKPWCFSLEPSLLLFIYVALWLLLDVAWLIHCHHNGVLIFWFTSFRTAVSWIAFWWVSENVVLFVWICFISSQRFSFIPYIPFYFTMESLKGCHNSGSCPCCPNQAFCIPPGKSQCFWQQENSSLDF